MQPHPKAARSLAPLACLVCGAMFAPYRASQQTCSRSCRDQQSHKRAAAKARRARPDAKERKNAARRIGADPSRRAVNLRNNLRQYGVTPEWYATKLVEQGNRCAICGRTPPPGGRKSASRLHVDHCHDSGQVRDLLCNRCNPGLGHFLNDPALLEAAAAYLRRHQQEGISP